MFKLLKKKGNKGQSVLEYVILIIIVIAALLLMQSYMARGTSSGLRESVDQISRLQFEPGNTNYVYKVTTDRTTEEKATQAGSGQKLTAPEQIVENLDSEIINAEQMYWGN